MVLPREGLCDLSSLVFALDKKMGRGLTLPAEPPLKMALLRNS